MTNSFRMYANSFSVAMDATAATIELLNVSPRRYIKGTLLPGQEMDTVSDCLISMSPIAFKQMVGGLNEVLKQYENNQGEIPSPEEANKPKERIIK